MIRDHHLTQVIYIDFVKEKKIINKIRMVFQTSRKTVFFLFHFSAVVVVVVVLDFVQSARWLAALDAFQDPIDELGRVPGDFHRHGFGDTFDTTRSVLIRCLIQLHLARHDFELADQDDLGLRNGDHQFPVFLFESVEFHFIGFVLSFLLETARPGGEFILFLSGFGSDGHGQFADGRHVVDEAVEFVQFAADAVQLARVGRQVVAVAASRFTTVLDAIDGAVGTEDGILNFVEDVRVDRFRGEIYLLTLGAFGLHVVLPEEALFLAHTAASTSSTISSALFVATSRVRV